MIRFATLPDVLWGNKAKLSYLLVASFVLLFTLLGGREIWTQEHRWADIVSGMFYRQDFLHPYLGENKYYDKPLLSYWLIVLVTKLSGVLATWTLRLPSALAGLLAIWSIYQLGTSIRNKKLGLLAGWLLLTTFYFVFWARTSSADMLNLAGTLFAIAWYYNKRETASFFDYTVFFMIIALTCLCKGLIGAIIPFIAVMTDIVLRKSWRRYVSLPVFLSIVPALVIYLSPFIASSLVGSDTYGQNGLYLVYKENFLRYFQPFDHKGPIYTYFIYLPLYMFPWALFFIPALVTLKSRWQTLSISSKWVSWTLLLLFVFFTLSGSRRSYYVLPLVPFAILLTADWILTDGIRYIKKQIWSAVVVIISASLLFLSLDILPAWYYAQFGANRFAATLKEEAVQIQPWSMWNVVMLDAESKLGFYLQLSPQTKNYEIKGRDRRGQTAQTLLEAWPILEKKPGNTIFITRKSYVPLIENYFAGYKMVEISHPAAWQWLEKSEVNRPVAFIPSQS